MIKRKKASDSIDAKYMPKGQMRALNRDGTFNVHRVRDKHLLTKDIYHSLLRLTWSQFLLLLTFFYGFANFMFALVYFTLGPTALEGHGAQSALEYFQTCFFFSVQTFATIGYGKLHPSGLLANLVVTIEAFAGLLSAALTTGIVFTRFARPTARVIFSKVAVICPIDGTPSLVFRIANARFNQIVEAHMNVVLLKTEKTAEGVTYRSFYDLHLERNHSPIFALTWTVIHPINSHSPLYGMSQQDFINAESELLISLTGIDDTFSQTIHARYSYIPSEILWGKNFKDIITRVDGKTAVNLDAIHDVEDL